MSTQVKIVNPKASTSVIPLFSPSHMANIQLTKKLNTKGSSPRSPSNLLSNVSRLLDDKTMSNLRDQLRNVIADVSKLAITNKAAIFESTGIVGRGKELERIFRPFFVESSRIYDIIKNPSNPNNMSAVNISYLKTTSFTFLHKWNEFQALVRVISQEGYKSNAEYAEMKLAKAIRIIEEVTGKIRKSQTHIDEISRAGGSLIEIINSLKENLTVLLNQPELMRNKKNLSETAINDVKAFLRVYNDNHFTVWSKTGYMQCELVQFKSEFAACCNDVIRAIRNGFCFEDNMKALFDECDAFTDILQTITGELNLPSSLTYHSRPTENIAPAEDLPKNLEAELLDFVGYVPPQKSIPNISKLELFIEDIAERLNVVIEKKKNETVWNRLDLLKSVFFKRINEIQLAIKEQRMFQEKIDNQSDDMKRFILQTAIKEEVMNNDREQLHLEIKRLKFEVKCLTSDNEELKKRIDDQTDIIGELRIQIRDVLQQSTIKVMTDRMIKMMTNLDENNPLLPQVGETATAEKFNLFTFEKKCSRCRVYEQMSREVKKKLKNICEIPRNAPLNEVMDFFINLHIELERQREHLSRENEVYKDHLNRLVGECSSISNEMAELCNDMDIKCDTKDGATMTKAIRDAFDIFKKFVDQQLVEQRKSLDGQFSSQLDELFKRFYKYVPNFTFDETKSKHDEISRFATHLDKFFYDTNNELKLSKSLLKDVEKWMSEKTHFTSNGMQNDQALYTMMRDIDEAPNPLQGDLEKLRNEKAILFSEMKKLYAFFNRISGLADEIPDDVSVNTLITSNRVLLDKVDSIIHTNKFTIQRQREELRVCEDIVKAVAKDMNDTLEYQYDFTGKDLHYTCDKLQVLAEELCNPGSNSMLIPASTINALTLSTRKLFESSYPDIILPPHPCNYIPILLEKTSLGINTMNSINAFVPPIESIFDTFDFSFESFNPTSMQFKDARDKFIKIHQTMYDVIRPDLYRPYVYVIQHLVALASSFLSCVVTFQFETLTLEQRKEVFIEEKKRIEIDFI